MDKAARNKRIIEVYMADENISVKDLCCQFGLSATQMRRIIENNGLKVRPKYRSSTERFWSKVDIRGEDECWEWHAGRAPEGYGRFGVDGKLWMAHRYAFFLTNGDLGDLCVLHSCDNPPCCNPKHLFLGTRQDNNIDKMLKGRSSCESRNVGEAQWQSKLTPIKVRKILQMLDEGAIPQYKIANLYNVSESAISKIKHQKNWKHISKE